MPDGGFNHGEMSKYHMKEELIRVTEAEYGRGMPDVDVLYLALSCGHCDDPACAAACPHGCIAKDAATGAVLTEKGRCDGCGACLGACPYGAPQFCMNPAEAPPGVTIPMVKCDLCAERIGAGLKPACVAACRVRALDALPMDALAIRYPGATPGAPGLPGDVSPATNAHTRPNWLFKPKIPRFHG
jgi:anaerobic dimethyl sulfoxide reductase subunit B (iron-sulfur subunit)